MARRKWKWPQAVDIKATYLGTEEKCNYGRYATSMLVGGLLMGPYGMLRADEKHGPKTVRKVEFVLTYPDGSTEVVKDDTSSFIYTHLRRLMTELESKNNTN